MKASLLKKRRSLVKRSQKFSPGFDMSDLFEVPVGRWWWFFILYFGSPEPCE